MTPVRLVEAARPAAPLAHAGALPTRDRGPEGPHGARYARPETPTREDLEHDALSVRRRALATGVYGAGTVASASLLGVTGVHDPMMFAALGLALFCGVATVAGTLWTWLGARRLGEAGISVFDTIDGSWRDVAAAAPSAAHRSAIAAVRTAPAAREKRDGRQAAVAAGRPDRPLEVHRVPATPEVLASRWGAAVTRAVEDRGAIAHLVAELGPADRDMIPDVLPTADVLVRRVGELAATLHELDRDVPPSLVADVAARLAAARRDGDHDPDQRRRTELLERQHGTLTDLVQRREQLSARLDGAALLLQNMRLDLLRLRSAGIEAALGELGTMTREASALSRDIGRALDVAEELRKE